MYLYQNKNSCLLSISIHMNPLISPSLSAFNPQRNVAKHCYKEYP